MGITFIDNLLLEEYGVRNYDYKKPVYHAGVTCDLKRRYAV